MFRHKASILVPLMVCLAILPLYSTNVFAQGIPEVIKRLNHIQKTLDDQIIPKLDQCTQCPECPSIGVPKTGQTTSYGPGDDGVLQKGIPLPIPRFTDNGNGTVTDNLTGLIWLRNANCFGQKTWTDALSDCNTLASGTCELNDGSVAGDWRSANVREIFSLIDFSQFDPALPVGHPFTNVQSDYYWSSTSKDAVGNAWNVNMSGGGVGGHYKTFVDYVWPVRDAK